MNHVMIDLETMGTAVDSAILSIGAVCFDLETGGIGSKRHIVVDLQSNVDAGRRIYPDTLKWWMQQSDDARAIFSAKPTLSLPAAMIALAEWLEMFVGDRAHLWANGPSFDIAILEHAYRQQARPIPWRYYLTRCVRTYRALPGAETVEPPEFVGTAHNALDDAIHQAQHVCAIHQALFVRPQQQA